MELSRRMKRVVDMVEPCKTAADIGCDHGYISICLAEQGRAERLIAMDVRTGPLSRARANRDRAGLESRIECRLSDGLDALEPGEADTLILAGMGGLLMRRILERGREKLQGHEILVLQPQSEIPAVRRYVHTLGYTLTDEAMLREDGKYYVVMQAKPAREPEAAEFGTESEAAEVWELDCRYGPCLLRARSRTLYGYLEEEERKLRELIRALSEQTSERAEQRAEQLKRRLEWNRRARNVYTAPQRNGRQEENG